VLFPAIDFYYFRFIITVFENVYQLVKLPSSRLRWENSAISKLYLLKGAKVFLRCGDVDIFDLVAVFKQFLSNIGSGGSTTPVTTIFLLIDCHVRYDGLICKRLHHSGRLNDERMKKSNGMKK